MVLLFIATFIDCATGYSDEPKLQAMFKTYLDWAKYLMVKQCLMIVSNMSCFNSEEIIHNLEVIATKIFGNLEDVNLFNNELYRLDQFVKYQRKFALLNYLDSSLFIKTFVRMTSLGK